MGIAALRCVGGLTGDRIDQRIGAVTVAAARAGGGSCETVVIYRIGEGNPAKAGQHRCVIHPTDRRRQGLAGACRPIGNADSKAVRLTCRSAFDGAVIRDIAIDTCNAVDVERAIGACSGMCEATLRAISRLTGDCEGQCVVAVAVGRRQRTSLVRETVIARRIGERHSGDACQLGAGIRGRIRSRARPAVACFALLADRLLDLVVVACFLFDDYFAVDITTVQLIVSLFSLRLSVIGGVGLHCCELNL